MPEDDAKFFIASVSATLFDDNTIVEHTDRGCFVCRPRKDIGGLMVCFTQHPLMFVWCSEAEATSKALSTARTQWPEHAGFTNHSVVLWEVPRSTFIKFQVFTSAKDLYHRLLRFSGF
jgi:hypothetical protein